MGLFDRLIGRGKGVAVAPRPRGQYLRGERTGILQARRAVTRDGWVNVREASARASALAWDFMQNSGWIAGAADQVITDTVGSELKLNARPDFSGLGYGDKERADWCRLVERKWRVWAWTPAECDLAGVSTVAEMSDGVMRYFLAHGEGIGVIDYLSVEQRQRYGIETGTKVTLVSPHRLKRETDEFRQLHQGVFVDENGRPAAYRFVRRESGYDRDIDLAARDAVGLRRVIHVMDRGDVPDSPRGISVMAPILKVIAQADQLADYTLAQALLQSIYAAVIKSPEASVDAFNAIESLAEEQEDLAADLWEVWGQRLDALKNGSINLSDPAGIAHLGPGEEFEMHTPQTPGSQYVPFAQDLRREMARRLGILFETFTLDFSKANYSSVRMGNATVWPIALRRRERIVAPFQQAIYEAWLDEEVATGRVPFKGGYRAFRANFDKVVDTEWRGPKRPSADPYKDALANKVELETGATTLQAIYAEKGEDWEEALEQQAREARKLIDLNLPIPFGRSRGGDGGPLGGAAAGLRVPSDG